MSLIPEQPGWLEWVLDGLNPVSWWSWLFPTIYDSIHLDNQPKGYTLVPADTVTLVIPLTAPFQEKLQQLNLGGSAQQVRLEVVIKVMEGSVSHIHMVKDNPANTDKLISVGDTGTGETCILCLDRVNTQMFTPRLWYVVCAASANGCKITVAGRIVTSIIQTNPENGQKSVTDHLHSPVLLSYGMDDEHNKLMAQSRATGDTSVSVSTTSAVPSFNTASGSVAAMSSSASDAPYQRMEETKTAAESQV